MRSVASNPIANRIVSLGVLGLGELVERRSSAVFQFDLGLDSR